MFPTLSWHDRCIEHDAADSELGSERQSLIGNLTELANGNSHSALLEARSVVDCRRDSNAANRTHVRTRHYAQLDTDNRIRLDQQLDQNQTVVISIGIQCWGCVK